jgi:hypothetical protein
MSTRLTEMPASRAASLSSPTAYTCLPQAVRPSEKATTRYSAIMISTPTVMRTSPIAIGRPVAVRISGISAPRMVAPFE